MKWFAWLSPRQPNQSRPRARLGVEQLEDRRLLAVTPLGPEFPVNTTTAGAQGNPAVARDHRGNFVVVWQAQNQATATSGFDIVGQRFNAAGARVGPEFLINTTTERDQVNPSVAMDSDGDFVVAWLGGRSTVIRRFNSRGVALGGEVVLGSTDQAPHVAMEPDGDFIVAWEHQISEFHPGIRGLLGTEIISWTRRIFAQRFSADGTSRGGPVIYHSDRRDDLGSEFPVPPFLGLSVASDALGNFVLVWSQSAFVSSQRSRDVFMRRVAADGAPRDSEVRVNITTLGHQENPAVAMHANGDFFIAWQSHGQEAPGGDGLGVFGRLFNAAGTALTGEVAVNTTIAGNQRAPSVATTPGGFLVAWEGPDEGTELTAGQGVFVRQFRGTGEAASPQVRVNSVVTGAQGTPSVAGAHAGGSTVLVWEDTTRDGSGPGIFGRRLLATATSIPGDVTALVALSPGLLLRRSRFVWQQTFTVQNLSAHPLASPLVLVVDGLSARNRLIGPDGTTQTQVPFRFITQSELAPGQRVAVTLRFLALRRPRFTVHLLAGV